MQIKVLFFVAVALLWCVAVKADDEDLSDYFSSSDATGLEQRILAEASSSSNINVFGSSQLNFRAAAALSRLSSSQLSHLKDRLCKAADADAKGAKNIAEGANALALSALLKCSANAADYNNVRDLAKAALDSGNLGDIYHATLAFVSGAKKPDASELTALVQTIGELQKNDGTFGPESEDDGSLEGAGYALAALQNLASLATLGESEQETLSHIGEKADNLVDKLMESVEEDPDVISTVRILQGLGFLAAKDSKVKINKENIVFVADFLVSLKASSGSAEGVFLLDGLKFLSDNKFHVPVVVTVVSKVLSSAAKTSNAQIRVTDILGTPINDATIILSSAYGAAGADFAILNNVMLTAVSGQKGLYQFNMLGQDIDHGSYTLEFQVKPAAASKYQELAKVKRNIRVTTTAAVTNLEITVKDSKSSENEPKVYRADHPKKIADVKADSLQSIEISFAVRSKVTNKNFHPHQAFVRFTNKQTKAEALFVTRVSDRKQVAKIVIGDAAADIFKNQNGDYEITIIVGDIHIDEAVLWNAATVTLAFADDPLPEPSTDKPELHHTFGKPEKRPAAVVSMVFTALVLGAFVVLLGMIGSLKISLVMPSGAKMLSAFGFHATLGLIMFLYFLYWWKLNMFQCLFYLAPLSLAALVFGSRALSSH